MQVLSAEQINLRSPYQVMEASENSFAFTTQYGICYTVGFIEDSIIQIENAYHLYITNIDGSHFRHDPLLQQTIFIIVEEFFANNHVSMLYLCDVADNHQAARDRLFKYWFGNHSKRALFTMITKELRFENCDYYAGLILRNDNPRYKEIVDTFNGFIAGLPSELDAMKQQ